MMVEIWEEDVREWPVLSFNDITDYFVNVPACDDQPNHNYRSILEGQNYFNSNWIDTVYHKYRSVQCRIIDLKSKVRYSQIIGREHDVQITVNKDANQIIDVDCDCIAARGKCCSHTAGLAFKILEANKQGLIGKACTDMAMVWN
ncbi:uncharacterized protein LOC117106202 [Anneissia japonica]|uniref:uncharacterized protein LOC117106202 n=1 Tax=Anneissia japonica TaxID=1529436 RepID=UPI00142554B8|nr:uncharacterized protein LOC117106202 [Anneissia japonica]